MAWTVEITPEARAAIKSLGATEERRILKFLFERVHGRENPRELGEPLRGNLREFWRYRVGDYRILCRLEDDVLTVLVVHAGHRKEIYRQTP